MMTFEHLRYKLQWMKKLMLPFYHQDSYSLYVLDTDQKHVLIMDPTESSSPLIDLNRKHEVLAVRIVKNLRKCLNAVFND